MAILVQDSFTQETLLPLILDHFSGTDGTNLSDHTPDIGGAWVNLAFTEGLKLLSDGLVGPTGSTGAQVCVQTSVTDINKTTTLDGYIKATKVTAGTNPLMLIFQYDVDLAQGASLTIDGAEGGDITLDGNSGWSYTASGASHVGGTYEVRFDGYFAYLYIDGIYMDEAFVLVSDYDGGKCGIVSWGIGTTCKIDDFEVGWWDPNGWGVPLSLHTAELGGPWLPVYDNIFVNSGNYAEGWEDHDGFYYLNDIPDVKDGYVQVKLIDADDCCVVIEGLVDPITHTGVWLIPGNTLCILGDDLGSFTQFSITGGFGSVFKMTFGGGTLTAYQNGVLIGTHIYNPGLYDGGKFGLYKGGGESESGYVLFDDFEAGTTVAPIVEIEKTLNYSRLVLNWGPRANFSFRMRPRKRVWVEKNSQKKINLTAPSLWTI